MSASSIAARRLGRKSKKMGGSRRTLTGPSSPERKTRSTRFNFMTNRGSFKNLTASGGPQSITDNSGVSVKIGDPVWVREDDKGVADVFSKGTLKSIGADLQAVIKTSGGDVTKPGGQIFAANTSADTPGDHCALIYMNEPCILENTRARFAKNEVYTVSTFYLYSRSCTPLAS